LAQIAEIVARQDLPAVFGLVDRLVSDGKNLGRLVEDLTAFFRDLLRLAFSGSGSGTWLQLGPRARSACGRLHRPSARSGCWPPCTASRSWLSN